MTTDCSTDYSTVTLHIPTGYYTRHLPAMAAASERFKGMKVHQCDISFVLVSGYPESEASSEVMEWAAGNLPPH